MACGSGAVAHSDLVEAVMEHGLDFRSRRVWLHGKVENENAQSVVRGLQFLDRTNGPIELWICSEGGDVGEMFGIYDIIRSCTNKITTIGYGEIASAACMILVAGDKRACTPNTWFMSHQDHWTMTGDTDQHRVTVRASDLQARRWNQIMAQRTKHTTEWWAKQTKTKRELWFNAEQMLKHGVVDEIWPEVNP